ncbi:MAG: hypothetical protein F2597_05645 [Actinobacteria bacterium]|nr:hypothetical protein [Actinomycetota bacterium]MSW33252.1 hypothetical protein [Actinomycetota bacterium]MSX34991.1 hypothetical protein [Actinomycetota bacterium]MSX95563.1 hypothetical protein [Actinomycetota bacterium]MSY24778.1 hypothetical protein [Actinomycetota bacterium]
MKKLTKVALSVFVFALCLSGLSVLSAGVSQAQLGTGRISLSRTAITLDDSQQQSISLDLDEPINCNPSSPSPCSVVLDFTSSIPAGMSVSPSSIQWASNEWLQVKTLTLSVTDFSVFTSGQVVHLAAIAASSSEYYSGYSVDIELTVHGTQTTLTTAPPTTTATSSDPVAPAFTG